jgi:hypothetical protein
MEQAGIDTRDREQVRKWVEEHERPGDDHDLDLFVRLLMVRPDNWEANLAAEGLAIVDCLFTYKGEPCITYADANECRRLGVPTLSCAEVDDLFEKQRAAA